MHWYAFQSICRIVFQNKIQTKPWTSFHLFSYKQERDTCKSLGRHKAVLVFTVAFFENYVKYIFSCFHRLANITNRGCRRETGLGPPVKYFYWPFQDGASFVDSLYVFFLSYVCYSFVGVCLFVSLSLSHWYLGSGVVLDCIDYWSLHPYLFWIHHRGWHIYP